MNTELELETGNWRLVVGREEGKNKKQETKGRAEENVYPKNSGTGCVKRKETRNKKVREETG